jgi:diguanylate cyclase (GGDEF)-like protein
LDVAVHLYQQESEEKVALLSTIQIASFVLMLLLLALVALFIFRPMVKGIARGRQQLEELNARLGELAVKDSLTGCWNRRKFDEIIEREMNTAKRYQSPLSLLFLDIDHFKRINDSLGHNIGDLVLAGLGGLVHGHIRASDYLVRWGGEEFVLLLPETKLAAACKVAEKLRQDVERARFAEDVTITVSLGVTLHEPGEDVESLVKRADCALYQAKSTGRNRVETAVGLCPESWDRE